MDDLAAARVRQPKQKELGCTGPCGCTAQAAIFVDRLLENESEVKALVSGIEGFKAYYLIRTADGTASISVYETEDGAAESNRAAAAWIKEHCRTSRAARRKSLPARSSSAARPETRAGCAKHL